MLQHYIVQSRREWEYKYLYNYLESNCIGSTNYHELYVIFYF